MSYFKTQEEFLTDIECLERQPRVPLAFLPTPIHELKRASKTLNGPKLFIKRDDQTGLALGGNKTRKLEYLLADALKKDVDTIITAGAIQSNHCRQTAAACSKMGLRCELLLKSKPPEEIQGNVLLDLLCGAHIHWSETEDLQSIAKKSQEAGHKPYVVPYGGSNEIGALAYANAMVEIQQQLKENFTHIVFASCSAGTQSGLVIGSKLTKFDGKIVGISIEYGKEDQGYYLKMLSDLANLTCSRIGAKVTFTMDDFIVNTEYAKGYAVIGDLERDAVLFMARQEGILLDPVYTGRAFGGLLDMIEKGAFSKDDKILFWHTGGTPALFARGKELL